MQPQRHSTLAHLTALESSAIRITDLAKAYNQNMSRRASNPQDEGDKASEQNMSRHGSDAEDEGDNIVVASRSRPEVESDAPVSNAPGNGGVDAGDHEGADEGKGGDERSLSSGSPTDDYVSAPTGPQFSDAERDVILYLRRRYGERLPPGVKWKITRRLNKWLRQVALAHGVQPWQRSFNGWRLEFGKMKDEIAKVKRNNEWAISQGHPENVQPEPFQRPSRMPSPGSFYGSRESTEEAESESDSLEQMVDLHPEDPIQKIVDSWPAIPTDPNQPYAFGRAIEEEDDAIAQLEENVLAIGDPQPRPDPRPRPVRPAPQAARPVRTVRFGHVEEREDSGRQERQESDGEEGGPELRDPDDML
ncbi:hypothetical protein KC331_g1118 [Hortaea werneckii]|nr:hypothetical protein KC331_g1118 [Hortaea werneckii]KAI7720476.1 hypothetical protein KC353_g2162 [Hortaea werneckii]